MTPVDCAEMRLLVQADLDGELSPAEAARVSAHVDTCQACAGLQAELLGLSERLRQQTPRLEAPALFRLRVAGLAAPAASARRRWRQPAAGFAGGLALAACVALAVVGAPDRSLTQAVVSGHVRALQPGHLLDMGSSDQHTVKPWFDGRLDYAPPVRDLAAQGFPLQGARLDVIEGRPVAALVYRHRQHAIDLFVMPGGTGDGTDSVNGYNVMRWSDGGMRFWAVSDVAATDLAAFVALWRRPSVP